VIRLTRKVIYMPTEKCLDLVPAIMELIRWAAKHAPENDGHENLVQRFQHDPVQFVTAIRLFLRKENEAHKE
jgi:hypothetical protein